jgi:hypothetical protein
MSPRQAFIDRHKHELVGIIMDGAMTHRTGGELGQWIRQKMILVDKRIGEMFDELCNKEANVGSASKTDGRR